MKSIKLLATLFAATMMLAVVSCREKEPTVEILDPVSFSGEISGDQAVDLGLSVKWAGYNVGAEAPEEIGDFFVWGEIDPCDPEIPCDRDNWIYIDENDNISKYNANDKKLVLDAADDAATAAWGADYRTPTAKEVEELIKGCDWTYVKYKGVTGWVATKKAPKAPEAGEGGGEDPAPAPVVEEDLPSIFFPVTGFRKDLSTLSKNRGVYLTSTLISAASLYINTIALNDREAALGAMSMFYAAVVRPVYDPVD